MNLCFHVCISVFCVVVVYVYNVYEQTWKKNTPYDPLLLAVGILSARENFHLREAARLTWLKKYSSSKNYSLKIWFVIGKEYCKIPPEYRLSKYGCDKWNIHASGLSEIFYTSLELQNEACTSKKDFTQGFSFKVNYPIVIKRLGILHYLLAPNVRTKVAILDIQTKEIIVQTSISKSSSKLYSGYLYEDVEAILLPKDYEGMVLVEGYLLNEACVNILWNDGGGVITFNRIYTTPSHTDSIGFRKDIYSAISIQFFIPDLIGLKTLISQEDEVTSNWLKNVDVVNEKLQNESSKNQDIFFVDITDTYRNIPIKLLKFYKWIYQNYNISYLMKTDDDTVVDIHRLMTHMKSHATFKKDKEWIWSQFRKDWPVNYIGKWADYDYRSPIYPYFPCGATYLMSYKVLQWLSLNGDYLFPYQGEDVAMGIWLSAIKPDFIDDELFVCDSKCNKKNYNRAQLTSDQIYEVWSLYEKCKNVCMCD